MTNQTQSPDPRLLRLKRLDSCTVSDAMDALGLEGVAHLPHRSGKPQIVGRAVTLELEAFERQPDGQKVHLGCRAIEFSGPENIIVVQQTTGVSAGCWGGLLSLGATVRNIAGVIADGPVRDIDEAVQYDFSIFSRSLTAKTARSRVMETGTNVPVLIDNVLVEPEDYVLADSSSIVFLPSSRIDEILDMAEMISLKEASMAKAILDGISISKVLDGSYEMMLDAARDDAQ